MKATRANLLGEFTGKLDGLIYYRRSFDGKLLVRRQWKFVDHPAHAGFASSQRKIFALQPSAEFIQDMKLYLLLYNQLPDCAIKPIQAWSNLYVKLMFALQKAMPDTVNLQTITRQQIEAQNLPCRSLCAAIEAGLLPQVSGYQRFTHLI